MTTGENAMMEGNMQNITSTGSYLTWCNDKVVALAILVATKVSGHAILGRCG